MSRDEGPGRRKSSSFRVRHRRYDEEPTKGAAVLERRDGSYDEPLLSPEQLLASIEFSCDTPTSGPEACPLPVGTAVEVQRDPKGKLVFLNEAGEPIYSRAPAPWMGSDDEALLDALLRRGPVYGLVTAYQVAEEEGALQHEGTVQAASAIDIVEIPDSGTPAYDAYEAWWRHTEFRVWEERAVLLGDSKPARNPLEEYRLYQDMLWHGRLARKFRWATQDELVEVAEKVLERSWTMARRLCAADERSLSLSALSLVERGVRTEEGETAIAMDLIRGSSWGAWPAAWLEGVLREEAERPLLPPDEIASWLGAWIQDGGEPLLLLHPGRRRAVVVDRRGRRRLERVAAECTHTDGAEAHVVARLEAEPEDPQRVTVYVQGTRVGHVPGGVAHPWGRLLPKLSSTLSRNVGCRGILWTRPTRGYLGRARRSVFLDLDLADP